MRLTYMEVAQKLYELEQTIRKALPEGSIEDTDADISTREQQGCLYVYVSRTAFFAGVNKALQEIQRSLDDEVISLTPIFLRE